MPSRNCGAFVGIAVVVAFATLSLQSRPFVLAAYSDGGLVPFARFVDGTWLNTWPAPEEPNVRVPSLAEIPTTWLGKPVPRVWTFWSAAGSRRRVTVVGARRGDGTGGGCTQPAVLALAQTFDEGTRGLAVDTDQVLEAARLVPPSSSEWKRLQPVIESAVRDNERQLVDANSPTRDWQRQAMAEVNIFQAPLSIETVYRPATDTSPVLHYFEAVRHANRTNGVPLTLRVGGWVVQDSNGRTSAFALSGSVFEDEGMWTVVPLAIVRAAGRIFWITGASRWESSSFVIRDVSASGVRDVLTTDNGGC